MATWLERLNQLKFNEQLKCDSSSDPQKTIQQNENIELIEPLYIDAPRWILKQLVINKHLKANYDTISISNINFNNVMKLFNNNTTRTIEYLSNERSDNLIYELSNYTLDLYQSILCDSFLKNHQTIKLTANHFQEFYKYCINNLHGSAEYRTLLICDCRHNILNEVLANSIESIYEIFMFLALLNRRDLYPLMEIIVICDENIIKSNNISTQTNSSLSNFKYTEYSNLNLYASQSVKKETKMPIDDTERYTIVKNIYNILHDIVRKNDIIINYCDFDYILEYIKQMHRSQSLTLTYLD